MTRCLPGEVNVFDSMPSTDLPKRAKEQIASIIHTPKHKFMLNFQATQTQLSSNDCGVFSIAFATSLCAGVNPAAVFYHQTLLRRHLIDSLVKEEIGPFPGKPQKSSRLRHKAEVCVYCICRQPEDG